MAYTKRHDGRKFDEFRKIEAKAGVIKNADGSEYFRIGNTIAYAAVYGPRELHPKFLQNPESGILRCTYNMMPFSGMGTRVRPGPSRRSREISLVMEKALLPVLGLKSFPNAVVDLYVEFPQTDAGSRCAGICASSIALSDAGIPMTDLVAAFALGRIGDKVLVDLDYEEEAYEEESVADIPITYIPSLDKFSLLQMDGEIDSKMLFEALEKARKFSPKLIEVQKKALKEKYLSEAKSGEEDGKQ